MRISFYEKKKKITSNFFLAKIIVELMAKAIKKTVTFNLFIIIYGRIGFRKLDNAISLKPRKGIFYRFLTQHHLLP